MWMGFTVLFIVLIDLFWVFPSGMLYGWSAVVKSFKEMDEKLMFC